MKSLNRRHETHYPVAQPGCISSVSHRSFTSRSGTTAALLSNGIPHHSSGSEKATTVLDGYQFDGSNNQAPWEAVKLPSLHQSSPPSATEPVLAILEQVANGSLRPAEAASLLQQQALGSQQASSSGNPASGRTSLPEIVYAPGKSPAQITAIMREFAAADRVVLAVRVAPDVAAAVTSSLPDAVYNQPARTLRLRSKTAHKRVERLAGTIAVITAASADAGTAEECRVVADALGCYAFRLPDVSTDKMDTVLSSAAALQAADVVVVVSGTDGALPSVIAGLVTSPVVAVPSVGAAGTALGGTAGLLGALAAASAGVAVSQVDSGVGAAILSARILRCARRLRQPPA